jgi:pSer/pThr/pTyr-binding forkhead associated (FHA) protein
MPDADSPQADPHSSGGEREAPPLRPASARELKAVIETERKGMPFLLYRDDSGAQCLHVLEDSRAATIGRGDGVDVRLAWDQSVSSVHAEAIPLGAHRLIGDEGISRNGTYVNGQRLSGRHRLRHGDVVRVGRTSLAFNDPSDVQPSGGTIALDTERETPRITDAQQRVLAALCRPYHDRSTFATPATNIEIAQELFLSVEAVKTHLRELYRRFALEQLPQNQKRATLAERALRLGLVGRRDT